MNALTRSFIISAIKSLLAHSSTLSIHSLHAISIKAGFLPDTLIANYLLNSYSKSYSLNLAHDLFDEMPHRDLISYSTLITSNSRSGDTRHALHLTAQLRTLGLYPNHFIFSSSVAACTKLGSMSFGEQLHSQAVISGFGSDPFVTTTLIDMYTKLGDLETAALAFRKCPVADPVMCSSMIAGYVSLGSCEDAISFFKEALRELGFKPTEFSFTSLIKASVEIGIEVGEQFHGFILKTGFDSDCFVGTTLVDMYGIFGEVNSLEMACRSMMYPDVASYNVMIVGYTKNGLDGVALECFRKLMLKGFSPNECTLSCVLKACGGLQSFDLGRMIQGVVEKSRFRYDLVVKTALIDMYMKCGKIDEGCRVFESMELRNTISYNSMISGHGQNDNSHEALKIFINMNRERVDVDLATFIALANSCSGQEWSIYVHAIKHGFGSDMMFSSAFLDSLLKQGAVQDSLEFFNTMKERNVISWSTIISGFTQLGLHADALDIFKAMNSAAVSPNSFTFSSILKACGSLAALEQGRCIHGCGLKHGIMDSFTRSSLLDMYANCGVLEESRKLFDELAAGDIVSWNTMITGYAQHGYGQEALELYTMMEKHNVDPNNVTFVSLLSACSRCGLVEKGVRLFELMVSKHHIAPCLEHYACMVDIFGRAGMLDRAKHVIDNMPFEADAEVWTVFLASCKLNSNVELAELARDRVKIMQGEDNSTRVALSNMYSEVGEWKEAEKIRDKVEKSRARKEPGLSWVQIA